MHNVPIIKEYPLQKLTITHTLPPRHASLTGSYVTLPPPSYISLYLICDNILIPEMEITKIKIHRLGYRFSIAFLIHTLGYGFIFGNHIQLSKVSRLSVHGFFS
jgi:hypothetical protein